jgi:PLP dependent protein
MAVSKLHPTAAILEAASLGISIFGENRVQEFQQKRAELSTLGYALDQKRENATEDHAKKGEPASAEQPERQLNARFHLIGHLQSNKAARAAEIFSSVDTIDSIRLAERLNAAAAGLKRRLPVLLEIKLSREESKTGLDPESPELKTLLERLPEFTALEPRGLMTVPPYSADPENARPYFARLRALRGQLASAYPKLNLHELSMGMSQDFAIAIEEGSTQIRVGTALFGPRRPARAF